MSIHYLNYRIILAEHSKNCQTAMGGSSTEGQDRRIVIQSLGEL
jgi:hypothetical protein